MANENKTTPICIYHKGCADGFAAAWAVWRAIGDITFHAAAYGDEPPNVAGRDVILVDFSYKRPVIEALARTARTVLVLDHHKTAAEDLAGLPPPVGYGPTGPAPADWGVVDVLSGYHPDAMADWARVCNAPHALHAIFDMDRSGAQIAWDFFHPMQPRPPLVEYVADRDLWRFRLPDTRAISAALHSREMALDAYDHFDYLLEFYDTRQGLVAEGDAILRQHDKNVQSVIRNTKRTMLIGGVIVPVANCPHFMASDVGNIMSEGLPFAASYYDRPDARVFSLRSRVGGEDVGRIAAGYGGGGHFHAAGFQMPRGWEGDA